MVVAGRRTLFNAEGREWPACGLWLLLRCPCVGGAQSAVEPASPASKAEQCLRENVEQVVAVDPSLQSAADFHS